MSNFGYLNPTQNENQPFAGEIRCRMVQEKITLHRLTKRSDDAPDFVIRASGFDLGSAWIKYNRDGEAFLSMTLDDPMWPAALNLTAFARNDNSRGYDIIWRRPRQDGQGAKKREPVNQPETAEAA